MKKVVLLFEYITTAGRKTQGLFGEDTETAAHRR